MVCVSLVAHCKMTIEIYFFYSWSILSQIEIQKHYKADLDSKIEYSCTSTHLGQILKRKSILFKSCKRTSIRHFYIIYGTAILVPHLGTPKAVHKMLGKFLATFPISGNFSNFEQLFQLRETFSLLYLTN